MSGLSAEFEEPVQVRTVPSTAPEARRMVARYDWRSHGALVFFHGKLVYQARDHTVSALSIAETLRRELGLEPSMCGPER